MPSAVFIVSVEFLICVLSSPICLVDVELLHPWQGCEILRSVCLCVYLSVCLSFCSHISKATRPNFTKFSVHIILFYIFSIITGPLNGPVLFCTLTSVDVCRRRLSSSVTLPGAWECCVGMLPVGGPARGWWGGRKCTAAGQYAYVLLE